MDTALSPPAEITAEWTVHAQLTIVRGDPRLKSPTIAPDENRESVLRRNGGCNEQTSPASFGVDRSASADASPTKTMTSSEIGGTMADGPLRVVYKWSTDDLMKADGCGERTNGRDNCNLHSKQCKPQSFTSSTSTCGGGRSSDSGCCQHVSNDVVADNASNPKCRSTCSIVLTACTDLYPTDGGGDTMAPPQYNTTATCVVTPTKGEIHRHRTNLPDPVAQFLSVKDAFCQTSDGEFKARSEPRTNSGQTHHNQRTRSQRAYDFRRATESMLFQSTSLLSPNVSFEEGTPIASLSRQPSHSPVLIRQVSTATNRTYSPGPNVRVHHTSSKVAHHHQPTIAPKPTPIAPTLAKKSPRTVHIDVYCTGSEAEDSDHSSISHSSSGSASSEAARLATHPGYLVNDDDAASNSTPQTVFNANQIRLHHSRITNRRDLPRRLATAQSESSSLPTQPGNLRQFILDQANAAADKNEINESKQMLFSKHMGDDSVTDTPLSKFSFSRHPGNFQAVEPSEGGYSSNYPNSSRSTFRDPTCSSISSHGAMASSSAIADDLEHYGSLSGGDSFEYVGQDWPPTPATDDLLNTVNKGWRSPEKERKFLLRQRKMLDFVQQNQQQMREQTEDRDEIAPVPSPIYNNVSGTARHHRVLFTPNYETTEESRAWLTTGKRTPSVVTMDGTIGEKEVIEATRRATPFGARVEMTRKKHFGPAKNPDCLCDHCRRWLAERGAKQLIRERAASVGDEQMIAKRSSFWLMRQ